MNISHKTVSSNTTNPILAIKKSLCLLPQIPICLEFIGLCRILITVRTSQFSFSRAMGSACLDLLTHVSCSCHTSPISISNSFCWVMFKYFYFFVVRFFGWLFEIINEYVFYFPYMCLKFKITFVNIIYN